MLYYKACLHMRKQKAVRLACILHHETKSYQSFLQQPREICTLDLISPAKLDTGSAHCQASEDLLTETEKQPSCRKDDLDVYVPPIPHRPHRNLRPDTRKNLYPLSQIRIHLFYHSCHQL